MRDWWGKHKVALGGFVWLFSVLTSAQSCHM